MTESHYYQVRGPDLWGDYGTILAAGMVVPPFRESEGPDGTRIHIERVGPFVPPITYTSCYLIVTTSFKERLATEFPDLSFRPVVLAKVVDLPWEQWDLNGEMPLSYVPESGEPEGFLNDHPPSPDATTCVGQLWELVLPDGGSADSVYVGDFKYELVLFSDTMTGKHIFNVTPATIQIPIVSETAKRWLQQHAGRWLRFEQAKIQSAK